MRLNPIMLRVDNFEKSLDYYTNVLNMNLLRRKDYPQERLTLAFLSYRDPLDPTILELSYRWN